MTAAVGLYNRLGLPQPWSPASASPQPAEQSPLLIYGAASAVGFYALQLARRSNIHPILCVAGRAADYVEQFIDRSKGDAVIDYRQGDQAVVEGLVAALKGSKQPLRHVLDAVSEGSSITNIAEVFRRTAGEWKEDGNAGAKPKITFVLGGEKTGLPDGVEWSITLVGDVHKDLKDLGYVYFRYIARGLQEGWFRGQRTEVVPGGLGGIQTALENLKAGKASGVKYVFRIADTEGVAK
jgi:hypothetical protein